MKNSFSVLLASCLILVISSCSTTKTNEAILDFSGIEEFWKIADILEKDQTPDQELWDNLFSTPGYKTFTDIEMPKEWLKRHMEIGIMPSKKDTLQLWLDKGYWDAKFPLHFQAVMQNREQLASDIKHLKEHFPAGSALEIAKDYFPEGFQFKDQPLMTFIFFDKDARGYNPVIFDAMYALDKQKRRELARLIAHEAHHFFRNKVKSFKDPEEKTAEANLVWAINQVHLEGMADMIDKDLVFANPVNAKYAQRYQGYLAETPKNIAMIDSILSVYSEANNQKELAKQFRSNTPNSGHPMGYYMAKTIGFYLGEEEIFTNPGNPFEFFQRYNQAALLSNGERPAFSKEALEALNKIERKYKI